LKYKPSSVVERLTAPSGGKKISLPKDFPPDWTPKGLDKDKAEDLLKEGIETLADLQDKLYAQDTYALLVIIQAMDAAGKDGAIKHVMSGINPQGCQVFAFKGPSAEELDHDYLWRCMKCLPERGRIGIFNRSYYEEVLVVRVHPEILAKQKLPDQYKNSKIWKQRFEQINNFEQYLVQNGVEVVKIFLNVSSDEQKRRFLDRIEQAEKNWKFSLADAKERGSWDDYMSAYEDMIRHTSTKHAPWHVIPADNKWFARLAVAAVIGEKLKSLKLAYPEIDGQQKEALAEAREALEGEK